MEKGKKVSHKKNETRTIRIVIIIIITYKNNDNNHSMGIVTSGNCRPFDGFEARNGDAESE